MEGNQYHHKARITKDLPEEVIGSSDSSPEDHITENMLDQR